MIKVPVVNREDYTMFLELFEGMLWFHTDIRKWTPAVKIKYLEDLDLLQNLVGVPLVALSTVDNHKLIKFGKNTGWKKLNNVVFNNINYEVHSRSK